MVIKVDPDSSGNSPYAVIAETNTGCNPSGCPQEMDYTWTMQSSVYGDGAHTVEIDTTDAAGNTDTETLPFTLAHVEQLASQMVSLPVQGSPQVTGPAGSHFGASVANVGDVTDSGYDDFLIGAPDASCDGRTDVGAAYLILGSTNTAPIDVSVQDSRVITFCGASTGDKTGTAVAAGGDVNGDGHPDLLIGAPGSGLLGLLPQGQVYVIFGGPNLQSMDLANFTTGNQATVAGSGFLIKGPALSTNINVGLGHPAPVPFGASLGRQNVGDYATSTDFNGDGLDDIVIGDSGDSSSLRLGAGTVWVIYGKTDGGTVDLSATGGATQGANQLHPSVNTGVRIFGADGLDEAGQATAWPGSVDGSGNASLVVTAPGLQNPQDPNLLAPAGGAYVIFGGNYSGDLDLAKLNQTGGPTGYRIYGPASANIATTAPLGDVNGDGTPDILLGGNNAAWVVTGKANTNDEYLNDSYSGYQISAPDSTYGPAQVAGVGDIDGDGAPDAVVSFPTANNGAGSSFLVYGRPTLTNVSLDPSQGFGADEGTRLDGTAGSGTGTSADALASGTTSDAQAHILIGQPGNNSVSTVGAPSFTPVQAAIARKQPPGGAPARPAWTYPYNGNANMALPTCRRAAHGTVDQSLGLSAPYDPGISAWGQGNARFANWYLSHDADTSHTMVPVDDAFGNPVAFIRYDDAGCFSVYDASRNWVGDTVPLTYATPKTAVCGATGGTPSPGAPILTSMLMKMSIAERACMKDSTTEGGAPNTWNDKAGWMHFEFAEPKGSALYFTGLEGFVPVSDISGQWTARSTKMKELDEAYPGCGGTVSQYGKAPTQTQADITAGRLTPQTNLMNDNFSSPSEFFLNHDGESFPLSRNQGLPGVANNYAFFFNSTSSVSVGDIARGMVPKTTPVKELDYMTYSDPNVPCGQPVLIRWALAELNPNGDPKHKMIGWIPFRSPGAVRTCP
jgi:hypothetical protein